MSTMVSLFNIGGSRNPIHVDGVYETTSLLIRGGKYYVRNQFDPHQFLEVTPQILDEEK